MRRRGQSWSGIGKLALLVMLGQVFCMASASGQAELQQKPVTYQPAVGEPHPDFILPSIVDRAAVRLSDLRGKKVLLVHFASW